jgi:hypothetical protein
MTFVLAGWPGSANGCLWGNAPGKESSPDIFLPPGAHATAAQKKAYAKLEQQVAHYNTCYCEDFKVADAATGPPGARQFSNTWFNLYSIFTAFIVAVGVSWSRRDGGSRLIESNNWLPDIWVFAVLFLGLGSMWFHASLKEWAGIFDTLSMYTFTGFVLWFTALRLSAPQWVFWVFYPVSVVGATVVGEILSEKAPGANVSEYVVLAFVIAYAICEWILWANDGSGAWYANWWSHFWFGGSRVSWKWWTAVASILTAMFFWTFSQTGEFLCSPSSKFQPHGLLWHPLAGLCALFLYFYWRFDVQ